MEAVALPKPQWLLLYAHKDITAAIEPYVTKVTYTDELHGKADELELEIDDTDGRWRNEWAPGKGDALSLKFGYEGEPLQPAGGFQIDELEHKGPPDMLVLKALAAGITPSLRTKRSTAFEGQSLAQMAGQIAERNGLQVEGSIADIRLGRVTQDRERDLAFLKRVGEEFGHVFTVRDSKLVFHQVADLKSRPSVLRIERTMVTSYSLKSPTKGKVKAAHVTYHDPDTRQVIEHQAEAPDAPTGDVLRLQSRSPDQATAKARADAALEKANRGMGGEGTITLPGDPRLAAGARVELAGFGYLDKLYLIEKATHTMDRSAGFVTSLELKA